MKIAGTRKAKAVRRGLVALSAATIALSGCATQQPPMFDEELDIDAARKRHTATMSSQAAKGGRPERPEPVAQSFDAKLEAGDQLRAKGDTERALWAYIQALEIEPEALEPRTRIGLLHLETDPDRAASIFAEVIERAPASAGAYFGLGLAYIGRDQPDEAHAALTRANGLLPDSAAILAALSSLEEQRGNHERALSLLRRAHELRASDTYIMNNLGVTLMLGDDFAEAVVIFERATLLQPDDAVLQNNLGLAYGLSGRYERAFRAFSRLGDTRSAHNNLGYVYFLNEKHDEALAEYEKALLAVGEDNVTVLRNIEAALAAKQAGAASAGD